MEILASISETTLYTITGPLIFEELIPLFFKETLFCFFIVKKNHVFILTQIIQVNIVFHRRQVILKFTPTHSDLSLDIQPADEHMTKDVLHYFSPGSFISFPHFASWDNISVNTFTTTS